jgi:hypothetical protein
MNVKKRLLTTSLCVMTLLFTLLFYSTPLSIHADNPEGTSSSLVLKEVLETKDGNFFPNVMVTLTYDTGGRGASNVIVQTRNINLQGNNSGTVDIQLANVADGNYNYTIYMNDGTSMSGIVTIATGQSPTVTKAVDTTLPVVTFSDFPTEKVTSYSYKLTMYTNVDAKMCFDGTYSTNYCKEYDFYVTANGIYTYSVETSAGLTTAGAITVDFFDDTVSRSEDTFSGSGTILGDPVGDGEDYTENSTEEIVNESELVQTGMYNVGLLVGAVVVILVGLALVLRHKSVRRNINENK